MGKDNCKIRNIYVWGFGATFIRDFTVVYINVIIESGTQHIVMPILSYKSSIAFWLGF